jgi:hypothetical protein
MAARTETVVYDGEVYEIGETVELVSWAPSPLIDDNENVPPGTRGIVQGGNSGDGAFMQLWVAWDNGSRLAPTGNDKVRKVS